MLGKSPNDVVIVEGIRTPFAKAGTALKKVHQADLGTIALKELISRTNLNVDLVNDVIIGNVANTADAANVGRVISLRAGLPLKVPAHTVHMNCASAMQSVTTGYDKIKAGVADIVLSGGTETMSQYPVMLPQKFQDIFIKLFSAKSGMDQTKALVSLLAADFKQLASLATVNKKSDYFPIISVLQGLTDPFVGIIMGDTAEILAKEFGITREQQDLFAQQSHVKAVAAQKKGILAQEITPVFVPPKFKTIVDQDVGMREGQTVAKLAKLKPYFDKKNGTVTVGNSCPLTDGAAMLLIMSREKAKELGYKPIVAIKSYAYAGLEPERMGLGPVYSTALALKKAGLELKDMGLIELNEAFAAQVLSCNKAFASDSFAKEKLNLAKAMGEVNPDILNVNGGAIALGHPVGATGSRLILTLMKEMQRRDTQFGLATLCIGGGQGGAVVLEKEG